MGCRLFAARSALAELTGNDHSYASLMAMTGVDASRIITPDLSTGTVVDGTDVTGVKSATAFVVTVASGALVDAHSELTVPWPAGAGIEAVLTFRAVQTHRGAGDTVAKLAVVFGGHAAGTVWPLVVDENGNCTMESGWPGTPLGVAAAVPRSTSWVQVRVGSGGVSVRTAATSDFAGALYTYVGTTVLSDNDGSTATIASFRIAGEQRSTTADDSSTVTIDNVTIRNL